MCPAVNCLEEKLTGRRDTFTHCSPCVDGVEAVSREGRP